MPKKIKKSFEDLYPNITNLQEVCIKLYNVEKYCIEKEIVKNAICLCRINNSNNINRKKLLEELNL